MNLDQPASDAASQNDLDWLARVTLKNEENKRYGKPPLAPPPPPLIAAPLLLDESVSFLEFLLEEKYAPYLVLLFGHEGTSAAKMIAEFRQAKDFHYFGHRSPRPGHRPPKNPGLFDETNAASKRALMEFTRLAYRWDSERRGQAFWRRIAWLLWNTYENLMALRRQNAKITQQEIKRIANLPIKRAKAAVRARKHRAKA